MLLAAADDNGRHFGHHCRWWTSPNSIKYRGKHKLINFPINLLNLLNRFDGGIGTSMLGGVGSSNPRHWRGERLHNHGDGVCLFVLFVPSRLVVVTPCM